ncbi:hypothetical protein KFK09_022958 [Dendrobium nobile]|uniref:Uncharacterized protein n=1 Tax=Dendrobium nobile TaxID=94219 RepID=A0A8T3AK44_DENNO|nr:hypothetical protein KFK09_022958 [Dendrobium nobile]
MNFLIRLFRLRHSHDVIYVTINTLTKPGHFFPAKQTTYVEKLSKLYVDGTIRLNVY